MMNFCKSLKPWYLIFDKFFLGQSQMTRKNFLWWQTGPWINFSSLASRCVLWISGKENRLLYCGRERCAREDGSRQVPWSSTQCLKGTHFITELLLLWCTVYKTDIWFVYMVHVYLGVRKTQNFVEWTMKSSVQKWSKWWFWVNK